MSGKREAAHAVKDDSVEWSAVGEILDPGFFVRERPNRASPRRTKKAGDFPTRKPDERNVTTVTPRLELHVLRPRPSGKK